MGDLVWVRLLFPKPLNFFPQHRYTGVFSVQDIFSPGISSQDILPPQNQSARYFLLKSPVPLSPFPSKVEWSAP